MCIILVIYLLVTRFGRRIMGRVRMVVVVVVMVRSTQLMNCFDEVVVILRQYSI